MSSPLTLAVLYITRSPARLVVALFISPPSLVSYLYARRTKIWMKRYGTGALFRPLHILVGRSYSRDCSQCLLQLPVATDQTVCRTVVAEVGFGFALEFRNDALRENLAEFDAPLVERIDVPDDAL